MRFDDVLKDRRSIRSFCDKAIPEKDICDIVDAARISPSAKNRQPWRFVLLDQEEKKSMLFKMKALAEEAEDHPVLQTVAVLETAPVIVAVYSLGTTFSDVLSVGAAMYGLCLKATDLSRNT